jgi:DNA (cytosine-5)-methyltransferase 1
MREPRKTLRDAIAHLPSLDAKPGLNARKDFHPQHYVPVMDPRKYWWVSNTQKNQTAFNNQCINPRCGFHETPGHADVIIDGKMVSSKDIPINCAKCGELLPRPTVILPDGQYRLLKGFHSAYRRMPWDEPARTITQNFIYEASDNKIHPEQNRVLSGYEAMVIQTINRYPYTFEINGVDIGLARVAEVIGESVPPYLIEKICTMMIRSSFPEIGLLPST